MTLNLEHIRSRYQEAVEDRDEAKALWRKLSRYRGNDAAIMAYKAAVRVLMAKFATLPLTKLSYLKEAMSIFRQAVRLDPANIEVRFLRFSIQHNLPAYLNESRDMPEDKATMLAHFEEFDSFQLDESHLAQFVDFFQKSGLFSEEELAICQASIS